MIGLAGSIVIIGALLFGSMSLQRALHASELYATYQSDQRRLIDYLSRDLRRAIGIASATTVNGSAAIKLSSGSLTVEDNTALVLTLPAYYQNNDPGTTGYTQPMSVVTADNRVDYGTTAGFAPGVCVIFRKMYVASEGTVCFVREEADHAFIIIRHADNVHLNVTVSPDGTTCLAQVAFQSPYQNVGPLVTTSDEILLRNIRAD